MADRQRDDLHARAEAAYEIGRREARKAERARYKRKLRALDDERLRDMIRWSLPKDRKLILSEMKRRGLL